eukprot:TRINITY_DN4050_c0_g1_i6.p1 TRINITY_DN4050_c0_g1~~TRINITY_DN4050_c0_g1_i6.p1  ORF type:complete len:677 (+),score=133.29 TRINITY_DN4050_c0_g1_i6:88-2118(+)
MDASNPLLSVEDVYRQAQAKENAYREALSVRGKEEIARQYRTALQNLYEKIFAMDFNFALKQGIENQIWKNCFYRKIEEKRKVLREGSSRIESFATKKPQYVQSLLKTLDEARHFYQQALDLACNQHNINKDSLADATPPPKLPLAVLFIQRRLLEFLYQIYLYFGDIARYTEPLRESRGAKWSEPESFYSIANILLPEQGLPHNQLAVIASSKECHADSLYRYLRSLTTKEPYPNSRANLMALLQFLRDKEPYSLKHTLTISCLMQLEASFMKILVPVWDGKGSLTHDELGSYKASFQNALRDSNFTQSKTGEMIQKMVLMLISTWHMLTNGADQFRGPVEPVQRRQFLDVIIGVLEVTVIEISSFILLNQHADGTEQMQENSDLLTSVWSVLEMCHLESKTTNPRSAARLRFSLDMWDMICNLLNRYRSLWLDKSGHDWHKHYFLPEDIEMRGFMPLANSSYVQEVDRKGEKRLAKGQTACFVIRVTRIFNTCLSIASLQEDGKSIYFHPGEEYFLPKPPRKSQRGGHTQKTGTPGQDEVWLTSLLDGTIDPRTEIQAELMREVSKILSDSGFSHSRLINPNTETSSASDTMIHPDAEGDMQDFDAIRVPVSQSIRSNLLSESFAETNMSSLSLTIESTGDAQKIFPGPLMLQGSGASHLTLFAKKPASVEDND